MKIFPRKLVSLRSNRVTSRWVVLLIDLSLVLQMFFLAYLIRFNFTLQFQSYPFVAQIPLVTIVAIISFYLTGSYKGVVRYTGEQDAYKVLSAAFFIALTLGVIVFLNHQFHWIKIFTIPRSIIAIHFLLNATALVSSRFVFKHLYENYFSGIKKEDKVLIYGAGDSGMITLNVLKNDKNRNVVVRGFIDDNRAKKGKTYNGVPVFHSSEINKAFIEKNQIKEIIISIQNISNKDMMQIIDKVSELPVKVKIVPSVDKWIDGTLHSSQISDVKIEDLLGRRVINLHNPAISQEIFDKVVLVTGASGSIGSEIARQVSQYSYAHLVLLDQAESPLYDLQQELYAKHANHFTCIVADIRDKERIDKIMVQYKPDIVFHAAAYKHVPLMEENPYEAVSVNIFGTKNLMEAAVENKVKKFVMISTDKAVNPTNVMGATKRAAEMYASFMNTNSDTQFITTRFGNVLGSNGSVIPLFKKQIEKGGPLRVTHKDITRFFMTIPEACQLVLEAATMGKGGEIFVFDMGESVKIFDLAKRMIQLSGFHYPDDIDIVITGLRPGEKLYEEVLANEETTLPTHHEKIMIAKVSEVNFDKMNELLQHLKSVLPDDEEQRVRLLKELVPEYISNNSPFSKLDNPQSTGKEETIK